MRERPTAREWALGKQGVGSAEKPSGGKWGKDERETDRALGWQEWSLGKAVARWVLRARPQPLPAGSCWARSVVQGPQNPRGPRNQCRMRPQWDEVELRRHWAHCPAHAELSFAGAAGAERWLAVHTQGSGGPWGPGAVLHGRAGGFRAAWHPLGHHSAIRGACCVHAPRGLQCHCLKSFQFAVWQPRIQKSGAKGFSWWSCVEFYGIGNLERDLASAIVTSPFSTSAIKRACWLNLGLLLLVIQFNNWRTTNKYSIRTSETAHSVTSCWLWLLWRWDEILNFNNGR